MLLLRDTPLLPTVLRRFTYNGWIRRKNPRVELPLDSSETIDVANFEALLRQCSRSRGPLKPKPRVPRDVTCVPSFSLCLSCDWLWLQPLGIAHLVKLSCRVDVERCFASLLAAMDVSSALNGLLGC